MDWMISCRRHIAFFLNVEYFNTHCISDGANKTGDETDDIWQRSKLPAETSWAVFIQLSELNCLPQCFWMEHERLLAKNLSLSVNMFRGGNGWSFYVHFQLNSVEIFSRFNLFQFELVSVKHYKTINWLSNLIRLSLRDQRSVKSSL